MQKVKSTSQPREGGRILLFSNLGVKVSLPSQWKIFCGCILMYTIVRAELVV